MSTYCQPDGGGTEARQQRRKRRIPKELLRLTDKEKAMCAVLEEADIHGPKGAK